MGVGRRAWSHPPVGQRLVIVVATLAVALAVAACAGPGATPQPVTPEPSFPVATFSGGTARATLDDGSAGGLAWSGGTCERGTSDRWLAVNIGAPNGDEYFGLLVGQHPYGGNGPAVASGGTFRDASNIVTYRHGGKATTLAAGSVVVVLSADLRSGTFRGTLPGGTEASGTFAC